MAAQLRNSISSKPQCTWIYDNPRLKDDSSMEMDKWKLQTIVRFYVFEYLHNNSQGIEKGIFSLIEQYSSSLYIIKYVDARTKSRYTNVRIKSQEYKYKPSKPSKTINHIKIVAVGAGPVGKTSLLKTYETGQFPQDDTVDYIPTVFDNYSVNMTVDDMLVSIGLWDTAGSEDYARLRALSYKESDMFLVCMEVCAFQEKDETIYGDNGLCSKQIDTLALVQEVREYCGDDIPICMVGTKTDLRNNGRYKDQCWSREEMEDFAQYYCECNNYMECSAINNQGLSELFDFAVRGAIHCRNTFYQRLSDKQNCTCTIL